MTTIDQSTMTACESTQTSLLLAEGDTLPAAVTDHLAECEECRAFQGCLALTDAATGDLCAPSTDLDNEILNYARRKAHGTPRRFVLYFPIYFRAAAVFVLLAIGTWLSIRQGDPAAGPQPLAERPPAASDGWQAAAMTDQLIDTAAAVEIAVLPVLDDPNNTNSDRPVGEQIEVDLCALQAEVYFTALAMN